MITASEVSKKPGAVQDAQCERMRGNNELLFGGAEIADPGPP